MEVDENRKRLKRIVYQVCDYKCFECHYHDCVNNSMPTKSEAEMLKRAHAITARKRRE